MRATRVVHREMDSARGMSGEGHEAFGEHTDGVFATARLRAFAQVDALGGKVSKRFVEETLWPEFEQRSTVLRRYLDEVTERVIASAIHKGTSDVGDAPELLGGGED